MMFVIAISFVNFFFILFLLLCVEMHTCWRSAAVLLLVICCSVVSGFYVPGVAPRDYTKGENVDIKVEISVVCTFYAYHSVFINRQHVSYMVILLKAKGEYYQNCSVLCSVRQLCTMTVCTQM